MNIKQISIFLENKRGRMAEVVRILEQGAINIRALSLADTADFGILRLIVNKPEECFKLLKQNSIVAQETEVIAVEVEDRPGGLRRILDVLDKGDINIEYMYAFVEKRGENAIVVFKIDEPQGAVQVLQQAGIALVPKEVVARL